MPQIAVILVVAAVLRLHHITQPFTDYISWRQASNAMMADNFYHKSWNIFYPEVSWNGPRPSYQGREFQTVSYIAALIYTVLGQHDWIGRGVAVLFGLWGIFALYQLVRRVWDEERALASAAVMAVLPGSIFIERSFLPDPAMVALVVTSFWMLVAYFQTERRRYLLFAGVIGAWGLLTKIPGLIVGLPMTYAVLAILGRQRMLSLKKLATIGFVATLTLLPVIAYYLWARHLSLTYPPYHFAGAGNWLWNRGVREWLDQKYFLPSLYWNFNRWLWTGPVIVLVLFSLLLRPPRGQHSQESVPEQLSVDGSGRAPWLFHWWLLGGITYYLIGARELVYNSWNFHIINPAAAALVGHAIVSIASFMTRTVRRPASLVTVATVLLIIVGFGQRGLGAMYSPPSPWDATESYKMGLALRQITQPDDLVVTVPNDIGEPVAIYYSQRRGWVFPPAFSDIDWTQLPKDDSEAIQLFEELRARGARWFGIVGEHTNELWANYPAFINHLEHTGEFHSKTPDYIIYRILSLEEIAEVLLSQQSWTSEKEINTPLVMQKFRYHMPEAGEAFLVWGINGWQVVPEEMRPAGTVVKDAVMHTPMVREGNIFVAKVQVPSGATIDYGFLITKTRSGTTVQVWEASGDQDYHTVVTQDGVVEVKTTLTLAQEQTPASVPGVGLPLLIGLSAVLGIGAVLIVRRNSVTLNFKAPLYTRRLIYLRDLLHELVARDMKLRYKRSVLGVAWSLLNPLIQMLVFVFLFRRVLPLDIPNYPLFVFSGVLAWSWFQATLTLATGAITDNRELIRRPGFPTAILPVVTVITHLIHFLLALPILLLFIVLGGGRLTSAILTLPLVILLQFLLILSLGYLVATFHVNFRDTQHLLGVFLMLLFYLTPVFYDASIIPARYQTLYHLNPMFHLITAYRTILIQGNLPELRALLILGVFVEGLLWLGHRVFTQASYHFVEEL